MPTYDYECKSCGHTFEVFHGMTETPKISCPQCNGEVRKLIGGGLGIIFKGSGFYVTDNKGGSSVSTGPGKNKEEKREPAAETSGTGAETKSDKSEGKSAGDSKKDSTGESGGGKKGKQPVCA